MQQHLYKYLVLNKRLGIPELGNFTIHQKGGGVNSGGTQLLPPQWQVRFSQGAAVADKYLFDFLTDEMDVDEVTAIRQFSHFSYGLKISLVNGEDTSMAGIGTLQQDATGTFLFEPLPQAALLKPVPVPGGLVFTGAGNNKLAATDETTTIDVENADADAGWWIYAVILLLLGIAAIAYHYL